MYPNSIYFGLKVVPIEVLWGQCIYDMSTWTPRVTCLQCATLKSFRGVHFEPDEGGYVLLPKDGTYHPRGEPLCTYIYI